MQTVPGDSKTWEAEEALPSAKIGDFETILGGQAVRLTSGR